MRAILCALLVCVIAHRAAPHPHSCDHACMNYETAVACNAIDECTQTVWSLDIEDESTPCSTCISTISNYEMHMTPKTSKQRIKYDLMKLCKEKVQDGSDEPSCSQMVNKHFDVIFKDLVEKKEPTIICRALSMCECSKGHEIESEVPMFDIWRHIAMSGHQPLIIPQGDTDCTDCQAFLVDFKNTVMNDQKVTNDWKMMLKKECESLGAAIAPLCENLLDKYFPKLMSLVDMMQPKGVCKTLTMCDMFGMQHSGDACSDCKAFFGDVRNKVMNDSDIIKKVDAVIMQECNAAPAEMVELCKNLVKRNLPTVWKFLEDPSSAEQICVTTEYCMNEPCETEEVDLQGEPCGDCKNFMSDLQDAIKNKPSIFLEIVDLVKQECEMLGPAISDGCKKTVDQVAPIVENAISGNDVGTICQTIMMCGMSTERLQGDLCSDCQAFVSDWQSIIANNKSIINELNMMLEQECQYLGSGLDKICQDLAKQYLPQLWEAIAESEPDSICSVVYFCEESNEPCIEVEEVTEIEKVEGEPCGDCKNFIMDLQNTIKNDSTLVQEIIDLVKQECDMLEPAISDVCKKAVDDAAPIIEDAITGNDVDVICQTIQMCGMASERLRGDLCTDCQAFVTDWQSIITNNQSIINEITSMIKQECQMLGPEFSKLCGTLVDEYLPQLWDAISGNDPETICSTVYFCDVSTLECDEEETKIQEVEGEPCGDCKNFIMDLQNTIKNDSSLVQEIIDLVKQECDMLEPAISDVCKKAVDDAAPIIEDAITGNDADVICQTILMCSMTSERLRGDLCTDCQAFVTDWQSIITNNQSVINEITSLIKQECQMLGSEFSKLCGTLVDNYLPELWDAISGNDPETICSTVYFCDETDIRPDSDYALRKAEAQVKGNEFECDACKVAIEEVEKMIEENRTEEAIESALQEVCELYGEDIRDECKKFMMENGDDIIDFLLLEMNSFDVCVKLGLCVKAREMFEARNVEQTVGGDTECEICTIAFSELDKLLDEDSTQDEIIDAISTVCKDLGKSHDECDSLVHEYGPAIIDLLLQELPPDEICKLINMCKSMNVVEPASSDLECEVCTLVAQELDNVLSEESTKEEIETALKEVCSVLPSDFSQTCDNLITQYGPEIVQLLIQEMEPKMICTQLKLCPKSDDVQNSQSDIECEVCRLVADQLDMMLKKESTQDEINKTLRSVCTKLPGDLNDECLNLIAQNFEMIVDLLIAEMQPKTICVDIKACPITEAEKVSSEVSCDVCQLVATELDNLLKEDATATDIEKALMEVCGILPSSVRDECDTLVTQYGEAIVGILIEEMLPSKICPELGLCPKSEEVQSDVSCEVCQLVAQELDNLLEENSTAAEIEKALMKVCGLLPAGAAQEECDTLVTTYGEDIIMLLVKGLAPNEICPELKLCPKSAEVQSDVSCEVCQLVAQELDNLLEENSTAAEIEKALMKVCGLLPSGSVQEECDTLVTTYGEAIVMLLVKGLSPNEICPELKLCPKSMEVQSDVSCEVCQLVAQELDNLLEENATAAEIEKALMKVCSLLPAGSVQEECDTLVTTYGEAIVMLLVKGLSPNEICPELKLCPKSMEVQSDVSCEVCQLVAQELDNLLEENATAAEIEKALMKVCGLLPSGSVQEECDTLVTTYGEDIVQLLVKGLAPNEICPELKLCLKFVEVEQVTSIAECDICQIVIKELKKMINEKSTEAEVLNAVNKVCDVVPKQYSSVCHEYILDYGPGVISILLDDFVPDKVCTTLGVCRDQTIQYPPRKMHVGGDDRCPLCKTVISVLDEILQENYTQSCVEKGIQKVCNYMPPSMVSECDGLIDEVGSMIFQYGDNIADPAFVCIHVKACPSENLRRVDMCMEGPSYWCQSMETAIECDAVSHCANHIWM